MIQEHKLFTKSGVTDSKRFLHTPGTFTRENLLYVQEAGFLKSLRPHRCIRENVDSYLFIVVLEGSGSLRIGETDYEIEKGDIALINCKEHYEHISSENDAWRLGWIHFNGHGADAYYSLFFKENDRRNIVKDIEINKYVDLLNEIIDSQSDSAFKGERKCGELILKLLNTLVDEVGENYSIDQNDDEEEIRRIREYLNSNFADSDIIEKLKVEFEFNDRLGSVFEKTFGISVEEYVENRRFNSAKELLRFTVKPVEEIAKISGLGDICTMNMLFRGHEKMSPEEYRSKWAGWVRVH